MKSRKVLLILALVAAGCIALLMLFKPERVYQAEIVTNKGTVVLRLLNETPLHRDNFIRLAESGYYNDMLFHRVVEGFVIQAGDAATRTHATATEAQRKDFGEGDAEWTIEPEIREGFYHTAGAVGMARNNDDINPERRSSGSHFYIVCGGNAEEARAELEEKGAGDMVRRIYEKGGTPNLDGKYTIFGYVTQGMETVDRISHMPCNGRNLPLEDIVIEKIIIH